MKEVIRKLLLETVSKHEACMRRIAGVHGQSEVFRRLTEIERKTWPESQVEVENRPMEYRHLLSLVDDLSAIAERYAACEHEYLKEILAQRYAEVLGNITDMAQLLELAVRAHPDLRRLVILRFQQRLPEALKTISGEAVPHWFTRLLEQPSEMSDFLSHNACKAVIEKVQGLLKSSLSTV